jgi:hypothetical protein
MIMRPPAALDSRQARAAAAPPTLSSTPIPRAPCRSNSIATRSTPA